MKKEEKEALRRGEQNPPAKGERRKRKGVRAPPKKTAPVRDGIRKQPHTPSDAPSRRAHAYACARACEEYSSQTGIFHRGFPSKRLLFPSVTCHRNCPVKVGKGDTSLANPGAGDNSGKAQRSIPYTLPGLPHVFTGTPMRAFQLPIDTLSMVKSFAGLRSGSSHDNPCPAFSIPFLFQQPDFLKGVHRAPDATFRNFQLNRNWTAASSDCRHSGNSRLSRRFPASLFCIPS